MTPPQHPQVKATPKQVAKQMKDDGVKPVFTPKPFVEKAKRKNRDLA